MTEKCGYVAIIGRPNVGKSTLLNQLIGHKISITSPKPQTTRNQILGIKTVGVDQAVFIDTPGLHQAEKRAMNRYLNRLASSVIADADVIIFMMDARMWTEDDETVLKKLSSIQSPVILVLNKVDQLKDKAKLLPFIDELKLKYSFASMVPMSAKNEKDVLSLQKMIMDLLPPNPHFFPDDQTTDKSLSFQMAELIREKVISNTIEELPYSTTVTIDSMEDEEKILKISAIIWVERESQKPIVIGKDGERLKKIGTLARKDIEKRINKKAFLRLWVKVKSDWTDNESILQNFLST